MILILFFHFVYAGVFAYVLGHLFGSLGSLTAAVSLLGGFWLGRRHARLFARTHPEFRFRSVSEGESRWLEIAITGFVIYAGWRHFCWLLFPSEHQLHTLSPSNFGDLPMHVNYIRAFANGIAFPPRNPEFASEILRYPYGVDLYSSLWEAVGIRLQAHLMLVGLGATLISLMFLRAFAGWYGIGAFFLSGGAAGWKVITDLRLHDFQSKIEWKNLFLTVFITQRGMLFALPIGLMLLLAYRGHASGSKPLDRRQLRILGGLWGTLPLFHLHAFLVVSLLLFAIKIECASEKASGLTAVRRELKNFFFSPMALIAYLPATYFIWRSTNGFRAGSVAHWSFGWTYHAAASAAAHQAFGAEAISNFLDFLAQNFGPWLFVPLLIAGSIAVSSDVFDPAQRRRLWVELLSYCVLFLVFFNFMLAPWDWDNIKLLIWPYLGFARLLWVVVEPRLGGLLGVAERPFVAAALFATGVVAILQTLQGPRVTSLSLYRDGDLARMEGALADVPVSAVFAASQSHQHPLTYFGRMRVAGYAGHLWSHGIDARETTDKLERIMNGDPEFVGLAKELGVTHILWGPDERQAYGDKHHQFMDVLANVSRVPGYAIYAVK